MQKIKQILFLLDWFNMALFKRKVVLKKPKKKPTQLVIVSNVRVGFLWIIEDESRMF